MGEPQPLPPFAFLFFASGVDDLHLNLAEPSMATWQLPGLTSAARKLHSTSGVPPGGSRGGPAGPPAARQPILCMAEKRPSRFPGEADMSFGRRGRLRALCHLAKVSKMATCHPSPASPTSGPRGPTPTEATRPCPAQARSLWPLTAMPRPQNRCNAFLREGSRPPRARPPAGPPADSRCSHHLPSAFSNSGCLKSHP